MPIAGEYYQDERDREVDDQINMASVMSELEVDREETSMASPLPIREI